MCIYMYTLYISGWSEELNIRFSHQYINLIEKPSFFFSIYHDYAVGKHSYLLEQINTANKLICQTTERVARESKLPSYFHTWWFET